MPVKCWTGRYSNSDLCAVVAGLQQLSYQANWVVIIMWVGYRPVDSGYMHFLVHREDFGDVIDISRISTIYCLIIDTHHEQLPVWLDSSSCRALRASHRVGLSFLTEKQ